MKQVTPQMLKDWFITQNTPYSWVGVPDQDGVEMDGWFSMTELAEFLNKKLEEEKVA